MNMDELNKQQIVLLTLLVSIVTSIATGITTISLVGQNPVQTVTQTVNRVVEKTIERVVEPSEEKEEDEDITIEKTPEKEIITIVVKEEDLTIDAIDRNSKSIVRVFDSRTGTFVSIGVVIKSDGTIYMPAFAYDKKAEYVGEFDSGSVSLELVTREDINDLIIMKPVDIEGTEIEYLVATLGNSESLKLGQSVISLSGINSNTVSTGIVTAINKNEDDSGVRSINTSVRVDNVVQGSVLLNLKGDVIGVKSGIEGSITSFSPASLIFNYDNETTQATIEETA